ncbi:MAG TPA: orotate phosphoribosyltransferase [Longimicrobiales bacterium]|nr:orotate phosphoribosyltransferase [Longimicrobiales bacterium]
MSARAQLLALLRRSSLRRGDFVLSSGGRSDYYIDGRMTTMSGEGQALIGAVGLDLLAAAGWEPAAVGGLTLGADPVAYAIANAASRQGRRLDAFTVRKESKGHGAGRQVEGPVRAGQEVVVVEDVLSTGTSALRAIEAIEAFGARVLGVLALVDRQMGGPEALAARGYRLVSACTAEELLAPEV